MEERVVLSKEDTIKAKILYEAYKFRAAGRDGAMMSYPEWVTAEYVGKSTESSEEKEKQ